AARRDVDLAAQNRVEAPLARVIVERNRREHVAVLGDGNAGHAVTLHLLQQLVDAAGTVEQRKLGVQVKVDEVGHSHSIVLGGFEEMSYTTRFTPRTSFTIRDEMA